MTDARVVLVTGGASGIGAATVRHFIAQGWNVVVNYFMEREAEAAEALVEEAVSAGLRGLAVRGDVGRDEDCRRMAEAAMARFGRIDGLVSSAGASRMVPQHDLDALTLDDFLHSTTVNTAGPFQIARACAPALRAARGAVVIVSSYGGITGTGSSIAYAASKGATNTLTLSLARVLAPEIRVNAVCPALVADGFVQRLHPDLFERRAATQRDRSPLKKIGHAADVAADIHWLVAGASLMTGAVLMLDAGLHLNMDG
ncbi:short-chain dehydrogenase [Rhizorhabdus wittichii DC-6]|nr:short-chain dehydrogenase [Rhizorhabdus wittichii DC-6]